MGTGRPFGAMLPKLKLYPRRVALLEPLLSQSVSNAVYYASQ